MAIVDEIRWFKQNFVADILPALAGTPLSFDLICAIAFQESGQLWSKLRLHLPRKAKSFVCQSAIHWTRRTEAPFHAPSRCLLGLQKASKCSIWRISYWLRWETVRALRHTSTSERTLTNLSMATAFSNTTCNSSVASPTSS